MKDQSNLNETMDLLENQTEEMSRQAMVEHSLKQGIQELENGKWIVTSTFGLPDFEQALKWQSEMYSDMEHPDMAATYYWIARALQKQQQYDRSLKAYRTCIKLQESRHGRYHGETAPAYIDLATLHAEMGKTHLAADAYLAAVRTEYRFFGPLKGPWQADMHLAKLLQERGVTQQKLQKTMDMMLLSVQHEFQGDRFLRLEEWEKAREEYQQAADMEELYFGKMNANRAWLYRKMAASSIALPMYPKGAMHLDSSHCQTAPRVCDLVYRGDVLYHDGHYAQAAVIYEEATLAPKSIPATSGIQACLVTFLFLCVVTMFARDALARVFNKRKCHASKDKLTLVDEDEERSPDKMDNVHSPSSHERSPAQAPDEPAPPLLPPLQTISPETIKNEDLLASDLCPQSPRCTSSQDLMASSCQSLGAIMAKQLLLAEVSSSNMVEDSCDVTVTEGEQASNGTSWQQDFSLSSSSMQLLSE